MIDLDSLICKLEQLKSTGVDGTTPVLIDTGSFLVDVEEVDLGASDEGIIIWVWDLL